MFNFIEYFLICKDLEGSKNLAPNCNNFTTRFQLYVSNGY